MITVTDAQTHEMAERLWPGDDWNLWELQGFIYQLSWKMEYRNILRDLLKDTKEEIEGDISALNSECDLLSASGLKPDRWVLLANLFRHAYTSLHLWVH